MPTYKVFVCRFWREARPEDGAWPNNLVPEPNGRRRTIAKGCTEDEARAIAQDYNKRTIPGRYSLKAEWTEEQS